MEAMTSYSPDGHLWLPPAVVAAVSCFFGLLAWTVLPKFGETFIRAGLFGIDMSKRKPKEGQPPKVSCKNWPV